MSAKPTGGFLERFLRGHSHSDTDENYYRDIYPDIQQAAKYGDPLDPKIVAKYPQAEQDYETASQTGAENFSDQALALPGAAADTLMPSLGIWKELLTKGPRAAAKQAVKPAIDLPATLTAIKDSAGKFINSPKDSLTQDPLGALSVLLAPLAGGEGKSKGPRPTKTQIKNVGLDVPVDMDIVVEKMKKLINKDKPVAKDPKAMETMDGNGLPQLKVYKNNISPYLEKWDNPDIKPGKMEIDPADVPENTIRTPEEELRYIIDSNKSKTNNGINNGPSTYNKAGKPGKPKTGGGWEASEAPNYTPEQIAEIEKKTEREIEDHVSEQDVPAEIPEPSSPHRDIGYMKESAGAMRDPDAPHGRKLGLEREARAQAIDEALRRITEDTQTQTLELEAALEEGSARTHDEHNAMSKHERARMQSRPELFDPDSSAIAHSREWIRNNDIGDVDLAKPVDKLSDSRKPIRAENPAKRPAREDPELEQSVMGDENLLVDPEDLNIDIEVVTPEQLSAKAKEVAQQRMKDASKTSPKVRGAPKDSPAVVDVVADKVQQAKRLNDSPDGRSRDALKVLFEAKARLAAKKKGASPEEVARLDNVEKSVDKLIETTKEMARRNRKSIGDEKPLSELEDKMAQRYLDSLTE